MSESNRQQTAVPVIIILLAGGLAAFVARLGVTNLSMVGTVGVALAAIWAVASAAVARLGRKSALLFTPALAVFVLSIVAVVITVDGHRQFLPIALMNFALSIWLMRAALRYDRRPRT